MPVILVLKIVFMKRSLLLLLLVILALTTVRAQRTLDPKLSVYQFSVPVGAAEAYLWIPPACPNIKAVMIALNNLTERCWLEDRLIRKMAAKEGIGIIWVGPPAGPKASAAINNINADMTGQSKSLLLKMLDDFAQLSGYQEIRKAFLIPTGHSAHGHFAWNVARVFPDRTLAAIAIKTIPLPDSLGFTGVPLLYMLGQTTEWPQFKDGRPGDRDFYPPVIEAGASRLRSANKDNLIGVVVEPGGGHFDWSQRLARFMAMYIEKACKYRLPKKEECLGAGSDGAGHLKPVTADAGWLLGRDAQSGKLNLSAYGSFAGDRARADWFFDKQTAMAAAMLDGDGSAKRKQMPTVVQDGQRLNVTKLGYANARFSPERGGIAFELEPGFLDRVPAELQGAGQSLGNDGRPVRMSVLTGPVIQTGPQNFQVHFDRGGFDDIWIEESVAGNSKYRHAVQPVKVSIPEQLRKGDMQSINFAELADQRAGVSSIKLQAVASSGLQVQYSVLSGPAYIEGDNLKFTKIPIKSRFPVKVTVEAFQWGSIRPPLVQTAQPVVRSFFILTPSK